MPRFHLIPNAHLDTVWLWDWREGLNKGITTCRTVLDLMDEYRAQTGHPHPRFCLGDRFICYTTNVRGSVDLAIVPTGRLVELTADRSTNRHG